MSLASRCVCDLGPLPDLPQQAVPGLDLLQCMQMHVAVWLEPAV